MQIRNLFFVLIMQISFLSIAASSGTVVGNGGEPVLHFLEATRSNLVETVRTVFLTPNRLNNFCADQSQLSQDQVIFCQKFFVEVNANLILLNTSQKPVDFVLRQDPLFVIGPDGQPMPVSARTALGPDGPIEFHFDSVKLMAPKAMLHLLTHELLHKVAFNGSYTSDNSPIGPFDQGRKLIDAIASSLTNEAVDQGRIARQFFLLDNFNCQIRSGDSNMGFRTRSLRQFYDENLANYKSSIGDNLHEGELYLVETPNTKIVYRMSISDKNHCTKMNDRIQRNTKISLWRVSNDKKIIPVLLKEETLDGVNPFCEKKPVYMRTSFENHEFNCQYYGTQGISNLSLNP